MRCTSGSAQKGSNELEPIIRIEQLTHTYSAGTPFQRSAVDGVELDIMPGEFLGVIGHTGSGKSTLIQHLNGLLKPTQGHIYLNGKDIWADPKQIRQVRFQVGLVFQYPEYQLFEETVYKDIAFGPGNMGLDKEEIDRRVRESARMVGLAEELLEKSPFDLSGGQKRRVAIAGVMAMEPKVLILDEPTAGLDPRGRDEDPGADPGVPRDKAGHGDLGEPQHGGDRPERGAHRGDAGCPRLYGRHAPAGICTGGGAGAGGTGCAAGDEDRHGAAQARHGHRSGGIYHRGAGAGAAEPEGRRREMLKDITLGQFFPGNTIVHRLDPRTKLMAVILYIVALFNAKSPLTYAIVAAVLAVCIVASRVPMKSLTRGLKPVYVIVAFTAVMNIFFTGGTAVGEGWLLGHITYEGLTAAIYMVLRIVMLIMGTFLLTYTTSPIALTDGLENLLGPLKKLHLPVHELAMMMSIALRFIPTLIEETDKIMSAQKARGADFESGNIFQRAKALVPILVPLFISAFRRADELATAMECRCYHGGEGRTALHVLRYQAADFVVLAAFVALAAGLIVLKHMGI